MVFEEYRISVSETTISRALKRMNFRRLSARPKHRGQIDGEIEAFKKTSPRCWRKSGKNARKQKK
ncbi:MAG: winged helix-turn-helix domain-containing protein [Nitrosomonas sp.]|uniref:winged helix-turn-helix domain-containing protein n=1 Tax=Nitrosomonas sp. TaxID=42353 RepID=UPI001E0A207A|nr:winged helix-turn-helix domain-containing protein [Nitrosomonas sp.]